MKFTESITIALARDRVIALLDSLENLALWQPDLLETRQLEGEYRQAGAKTELRYKMGKKELVMVETIVERTLPDAIVVQYQSKDVWNQLHSTFSQTDADQTLWTLHCEFQCRGYMKLFAWLMPWAFKKETRETLQSFKKFAEQSLQDSSPHEETPVT